MAACKAPPPDSTITTDRPTFANASTTVPCHTLQLETGLLVSSKAGQRGFDLPEASLRYGLADTSELRLGVPDYFQNHTSGISPATGVGDFTVGEKQQLYTGSNGADIALVTAISFPTGAQAVSSHGYDAAVQLPGSAKLSANTTVAGQFGITWRRKTVGTTPPVKPTFTSINSWRSAGRLPGIQRRLSAAWITAAHPGLWRILQGDLTPAIDVHAGFGLSAAVTDRFYALGYSVRFGR